MGAKYKLSEVENLVRRTVKQAKDKDIQKKSLRTGRKVSKEYWQGVIELGILIINVIES